MTSENCSFIFFGYVIGQACEWGYFSLEDLLSVRGSLALPIERDLDFIPCRFTETDAGKEKK